jgi:hypothetical protein
VQPVIEMAEWPSFLYWTADDSRIKQFWYVSFCLLLSAVQDRLTGIALKESENLNWSITAHYYSCVHAGRLACFLCCGDYPKGHADLAVLLQPGKDSKTLLEMDWLGSFVEASSSDGQPSDKVRCFKQRYLPKTHFELLDKAMSTRFPTAHQSLPGFSPILSKFKSLRNDCNYEALLVSHERDHRTATGVFKDLAASADKSSALGIEMAIAAYLDNLSRAACFGRERSAFAACHREYIADRVSRVLGDKFSRSCAACEELCRIVDKLTLQIGPPQLESPVNSYTFLSPILMSSFGKKTALLERWTQDVQALTRALGRGADNE